MQLLVAPVLGPGLGGGDLGQLQAGDRRLDLGRGLVEAGAQVGVVDTGDHLPRPDVLALLDEDLGDPAGDLAGDGGLAAGDDIAGGVQQRGSLGRAARCGGRLGGRHGHGHPPGLHHDEHDGEDHQDDGGQRAAKDPPQTRRRPAARARTRVAVDLQLADQRGPVHGIDAAPQRLCARTALLGAACRRAAGSRGTGPRASPTRTRAWVRACAQPGRVAMKARMRSASVAVAGLCTTMANSGRPSTAKAENSSFSAPSCG